MIYSAPLLIALALMGPPNHPAPAQRTEAGGSTAVVPNQGNDAAKALNDAVDATTFTRCIKQRCLSITMEEPAVVYFLFKF